jgi:hypothetical protein
VARLSSGWRRRVGWYPGDWIWLALLALVVATAAGFGAAVFSTRDHNRQLVDATNPTTAVPTATAPKPPERSASTPTSTRPRSRRPQPRPPAATIVSWPSGKSGWTVVLSSVPATSGRAFARAQARQAVASGVRNVGVLDSARFSSLHPGYYVVFSGIYSSLDDAATGVTSAHSHGYPRAYARQITP